MSDDTKKGAQLGPFADDSVTAFEISPIKFTISRSRKASHVPPDDCGCGGGSMDYSALSDTLMKTGAAIMDQLGKIRRNQAVQGPVADAGFRDDEEVAGVHIPHGSNVKDADGNPL